MNVVDCVNYPFPLYPLIHQISSPYTFTGIDPGTYCVVGLNGIYGSELASLSTAFTTTLSGKLHYIIKLTIIILLLHYLQYPHHLSVVSLYHQLR